MAREDPNNKESPTRPFKSLYFLVAYAYVMIQTSFAKY